MRMIKAFISGTLIAIGAAAAAQADAWTDAAGCVQNQLNALGFNAGKPTGRVSPATRKALASYQSANGALSSRKLDADTAVVYCRLLGLKHPQLKAYWPSQKTPYVLRTSATIDAATRQHFDSSIRAALSGIRNKYGVELSNTVYVSVGQSSAEMVQLLSGIDRFGSKKDRLEYWDARCSARDKVSGAAWPGMIGICRDGPVTVGNGLKRRTIDHLIAHEVFHDVQAQLVGRPKNPRGGRDLNFDGPLWMTEGTAEFVGTDVVSGLSFGSYGRYLRGKIEAKPDLFLTEARASRRHYTANVYYGGALGVIQLVQRSGKPSVVSFYDLMGKGVAWRQAFQTAFGVSVDQFYNTYDRRF